MAVRWSPFQPPKITKPANGVKVQFTTLHQNFGQPLAHPSNNLTYSQLMGWSKLMPTGDLVIWDYVTSECSNDRLGV